MALAKPQARDLFGDASPTELVERHEQFTKALEKSLSQPRPFGGGTGLSPEATATLEKGLSPETLRSVQNQLAGPEVNKDLTLTSPLSTGLVGYDLEQPALLLAPRPTPLRNRIPRRKGAGNAHQFKRILGFTGTGTGGVGVIHPGITESTRTTFGSIDYVRGPKIQYASDEKIVPYKSFGLSDSVSFQAQFAGASFQDIRKLSQMALLYSSMLAEERMLLGGRGTSSGFAGALAAPTGLSLSVRNAGSNETGNTANIANLYVRVTSVGMFGESVSSSEASTTGLAAATGKVIDIALTDAPGALGYKVYVGTTTGAANCYPAAVANSSASLNVIPAAAGTPVAGKPITINFTGAGTGGAPNSGTTCPTSDATAHAAGYDGMLSYVTSEDAGYVKRINSALNASNPGSEFQEAFAVMYDANKADPDEILANGHDRKQLSDTLKSSASSNYRLQLLPADAHNAQIGSLVTGVQNQVTGKMVDLTVHPWLPQGNMPILSWTLPIPDSSVDSVWAAYNVADYQGYDWPVTQFTYDCSSYWQGTFVCHAEAWNGCIQGVFKA